jgi:hypothetical protein
MFGALEIVHDHRPGRMLAVPNAPTDGLHGEQRERDSEPVRAVDLVYVQELSVNQDRSPEGRSVFPGCGVAGLLHGRLAG